MGKLLTILATTLILSTGVHAQLIEQSRRESSKQFDGFDLPASEAWIGDVQPIAYELSPETDSPWRAAAHSGTTIPLLRDGSSIDFRLADDPTPAPIHLVSLTPRLLSDAHARVSVQGETTRSRMGRTASTPDELPLYAQVESDSGFLLADASAYSRLESWADATTIEASGRVGSHADIRSSITTDDSSAASVATSSLTAKYHLGEEHDFVLDTTLAADLVEDGFSFRIRNAITGEELIRFQPNDQESRRLEMCGTLKRGTYELIIETNSAASTRTSGTPDFGGLGQFDLYFRAFTLEDHNDASEDSHDPTFFVPSGAPSPVDDFTSDGHSGWVKIDFFLSESSEEPRLVYLGDEPQVSPVPEPNRISALPLGLLLLLGRRRRR